MDLQIRFTSSEQANKLKSEEIYQFKKQRLEDTTRISLLEKKLAYLQELVCGSRNLSFVAKTTRYQALESGDGVTVVLT